MQDEHAIAGGANVFLHVSEARFPRELLADCELRVVTTLDEADIAVVDTRDDGAAAIITAAQSRSIALWRCGNGPEEDGDLPSDAASARYALRRALVLSSLDEEAAGEPLLGSSKPMMVLRDVISRAADTEATILVRGETGTGKELVARRIHQKSRRAEGPFITLHCAALPDALLESELFGHERGAFTGATSRRLGHIERATGGTLFLDEIGDITPATQVKLLRVLQERKFTRLGGHVEQDANVRFVAATHQDLEQLVARGEFRQDLLYRLNVVVVWVPPLRTRRKDITQLAARFCEELGQRNHRPGVRFDDDALAALRSMKWPGNVRELQNFVERLVVLSRDAVITARAVEHERRERIFTDGDALQTSISVAKRSASGVVPLKEQMAAAEKQAIERALAHADNNRSRAARLLGISRAAFYCKLKEHGI